MYIPVLSFRRPRRLSSISPAPVTTLRRDEKRREGKRSTSLIGGAKKRKITFKAKDGKRERGRERERKRE